MQRSLLLMLAIAALPATARADDTAGAATSTTTEPEVYTAASWPTEVILRPLTLARGMLELRGATVEANLSADRAFKPVELAPSLFYGITDDMTVGVSHGQGVRGPSGICLTGTSNGCPHVYNNINLEAYHALAKGKLWVASHPSLEFPAFSPELLVGFRIAVTMRYRVGPKLAVLADPGVLIGFNKRGATSGGNATEVLSIPIQLEAQLTPQLEAALTTNLVGSLSDPSFGNDYRIPLGVAVTYAASHVLDLGAQFVFTNVLGHQASGAMAPGRLDERVVVLRVAFRH